jgi:hypothetical protein
MRQDLNRSVTCITGLLSNSGSLRHTYLRWANHFEVDHHP